eukprot:2686372-Amphidinium_carterae.1
MEGCLTIYACDCKTLEASLGKLWRLMGNTIPSTHRQPSVTDRGNPSSSCCKLVLKVFLGSNLLVTMPTQLLRHDLAGLDVGKLTNEI